MKGTWLGHLAGTPVAISGGFMPIEAIDLGDRVLTAPAELQDSASGVNPPTWRMIDLEMPMPNPQHPADPYRLSLLRPESWLRQQGWTPGSNVWFEIAELNLTGEAAVLAVEPCPPVASGEGRVVTMIVTHLNSFVRELRVEGVPEPIFTTRLHPFYSPSRGGWVQVRDLKAGDSLLSRDGTERELLEIRAVEGDRQVYNIEVEDDHRYFVSHEQVLVHNNCQNAPETPGVYHVEARGEHYTGSGVNLRERMTDPEHPARDLFDDPNAKISIFDVDISKADASKTRKKTQRAADGQALRSAEQDVMDMKGNVPKASGSRNQRREASEKRHPEFKKNHNPKLGKEKSI
ncbi:MAG: polymorphic toxin-type HINT domain-containing protein [Verrucomicrobiales bacterium]